MRAQTWESLQFACIPARATGPERIRGLGWARDMRPRAALIAVLIHVGMGYWLLRVPTPVPVETDPLIMQVVFLPKRVATPKPQMTGASRSTRPDHVVPIASTLAKRGLVRPVQATSDSAPPARTLRLALPDTLTVTTMASADPLSKRASIDYTPTRFDRHWASDGNAVEQLAWRHQAVAMALAAFGGNRHICTDEDKRQRMRGCAPDIDAGIAPQPSGE